MVQIRQKMLVTGATGFVGFEVLRQASQVFNAVGLFNQTRLKPEKQRALVTDAEWLRLDLTDTQALLTMLSRERPDCVVHCAALSDPNSCEQNADLSFRLNVAVTEQIAKWCGEHDKKLIFCSTDLVFDGAQAPYFEDSGPSPLNIYAKHKVMCEQNIRELCKRYVIARLPLMFGISTLKPAPLMELMRLIKQQQPMNLFHDEFRTPVSYATAAKGLLLALAYHQGILHLGGSERVSRVRFAELVAESIGYSLKHKQEISRNDIAMPAARPADVSLKSMYADKIGFTTDSLLTQLRLEQEKIGKLTSSIPAL